MLGALQPRAPRQQQQERGDEQRQVTSRRRRHRHAARKARAEAARHQIQPARCQRRQHDEGLTHAAEHLQERQGVHVEADVATEDGIGDVERDAVPPREPDLPASGGVEADDHGQQRGRGGRDSAQLLAARQGDFDALARREDGPQIANRCQRQAKVEEKPADRDDEGRREERALRPQHRGVDVLIAHFAEPEPVGVEAEERRPGQEEQDDDEGEQRYGQVRVMSVIRRSDDGRVYRAAAD